PTLTTSRNSGPTTAPEHPSYTMDGELNLTVLLLEPLPTDEAAGRGDKSSVEFGAAFPADGETLEPVEEGERLLGDAAELVHTPDVR
ncbi:hypothetical protein, partial [Streptomyces cinereoruber]|uniref:hypothetical protein n=1 Tax=Streptomyces cinereoruber TaxID=67260 RepID=UPI00366A51A6